MRFSKKAEMQDGGTMWAPFRNADAISTSRDVIAYADVDHFRRSQPRFQGPLSYSLER